MDSMVAKHAPKTAVLSEVKELPLSADLLAYYRSRIDCFEKEKEEMIESIKLCDVRHSDMHKLQWQIAEREEELYAAQSTLRDKEVDNLNLRESVIRLQSEQGELKAQEVEDRRRIQELLALAGPSQQEVSFMRDARPTKTTRAVQGSSGRKPAAGHTVEVVGADPSRLRKSSVKTTRMLAPGTQGATRGTEPQTRMLRTVYLPTEKTDSLLLTIEALRRELDEHRALSDERAQTILGERSTRAADERERTARLLGRVKELEERNLELTTLLRNNEKEYMILRHNSLVMERLMKEETEELRAEVSLLADSVEDAESKAMQEQQKLVDDLKRQTEGYVSIFKNHAQLRETEMDELQDKYSTDKHQSSTKIASLEGRMGKMQERLRHLERVRALRAQQEAFESEMSARREQRKLDVERAAPPEPLPHGHGLGRHSVGPATERLQAARYEQQAAMANAAPDDVLETRAALELEEPPLDEQRANLGYQQAQAQAAQSSSLYQRAKPLDTRSVDSRRLDLQAMQAKLSALEAHISDFVATDTT